MPSERDDEYSRSKKSHRHRSRSVSPRRGETDRKHKHIKQEREDVRGHPQGRSRSRSPIDRHRHHHVKREVKREPEDRRRPVKEEPRDRRGYERDSRRSHQDDSRRRHDRQRADRRDRQQQREEWGRPEDRAEEQPPQEKEKPNFGLSGKLTADTNTFKGVVIKYNEPPEARKPRRKWRLYPFKGEESLPILHMHRQSAYLLGRERKIADIPIDHPSCSKQHAVFQYRLVDYERPDGRTGKKIKPYIIDLDSANGTFVNNKKIDGQRYVELMEKDVIKFGFSSREYVLLHDNMEVEQADSEVEDDA